MLLPGIQITGQNAVLEGQTISLQCDATGDDLDWFKDGQRLDWWIREAAGISIRMIPSTDTISSILQVESARARDAGIYVCRSSSLEITSVRVSVWHGPVQSEQHSCGRAWMCMQPLQSTLQLIGSADFATLADSIDDVCRAVELLGTCIGNWMSSTPECTPSDGQVLRNLIDNNTAQLCQNDSL
ncbi:hypothetical protein BaRGS_00012710 [Batillaria attramentaria]|uniref:Ig-like domain-containing protein n=1 Tax=Batillaria attramentaria TaxID=370345 RepID=A0ABD0L9D1_9CAEN